MKIMKEKRWSAYKISVFNFKNNRQVRKTGKVPDLYEFTEKKSQICRTLESGTAYYLT